MGELVRRDVIKIRKGLERKKDTVMKYDFRTKSQDELTFYVFDNLRLHEMAGGSSIYCYDTVEEAIKKFTELPNNWTTAIGCSFGNKHEIDLVQRVNEKPVRVMDFYGIKEFRERPDVNEAMEQLEKDLSIQYQLVFGIHPKRSVLAPLEEPEYLDSHLNSKVLFVSPRRRSNSFFASMNEVYVQGQGWMDVEEFLKVYPHDRYTNSHSPVVEKVNANYIEVGTNRIGQCDMSPISFKNMLEKTKMYHLSLEDKGKSRKQREPER